HRAVLGMVRHRLHPHRTLQRRVQIRRELRHVLPHALNFRLSTQGRLRGNLRALRGFEIAVSPPMNGLCTRVHTLLLVLVATSACHGPGGSASYFQRSPSQPEPNAALQALVEGDGLRTAAAA